MNVESVKFLLTMWESDPDARVASDAGNLLQSYGGGTALAALAACLDAVPAERQADVVGFIGRRDTPASDSTLEKLLKHQSPGVRAAAVTLSALKRHTDADPWPTAAVTPLAGDPDPQVRAALASSLLPADPRQPVAPLLLKLLSDQSAVVRLAAADTLARGNVADPDAPAPAELAALLDDPESAIRAKVRAMTFWSLASVVEPFHRQLGGDRATQLAVLETLKRGAAPELRPDIIALSVSPDEVVRTYAVGALGGLPADSQVATTIAKFVVSDPSPAVRSAARGALESMSRRLAKPPRVPRRRPTSRIAGVPAAPTRPASTVPAAPTAVIRPFVVNGMLVPRLSFPDSVSPDAGPFLVAEALTGCPSVRTVRGLLDLIENEDPSVSSAATYALAASTQMLPTLTEMIAVEAADRSPLSRAIVVQALMLPMNSTNAGVKRLTAGVPEIAAGSGRAADIAGLDTSSKSGQPPHEIALRLAEDPNTLLRTRAIARLLSGSRRTGGVESPDRSRGIAVALGHMEEADVSVARTCVHALAQAGAFQTGVPGGQEALAKQCQVLAQSLLESEPAARADLLTRTLAVKDGSAFFFPTWERLVTDPDPVVRKLAVHRSAAHAEPLVGHSFNDPAMRQVAPPGQPFNRQRAKVARVGSGGGSSTTTSVARRDSVRIFS